MKFLFFKKFSILVLVTIFISNFAVAYDLESKKSILFFKTYGKYPYAIKYNSFSNELDLILFGYLNKNGDVKLVKKAQDLETIVPVQFTMNLYDNAIKIKKTYKGFHETNLMILADEMLRTFGFLPGDDYKNEFPDDFFVSEYKSGMSMRWTFPTIEHFNFTKNYLSTKFKEANVSPLDQKPLLLIEIEDGTKPKQTDIDFLKSYFEIADTSNSNIQDYFAKYEKTVNEILPNLHNLHRVGQSFGELVIDMLEKYFDKGEFSKLMVRSIKYVTIGLTILLAAKVADRLIIDPTCRWIARKIKHDLPTS